MNKVYFHKLKIGYKLTNIIIIISLQTENIVLNYVLNKYNC